MSPLARRLRLSLGRSMSTERRKTKSSDKRLFGHRINRIRALGAGTDFLMQYISLRSALYLASIVSGAQKARIPTGDGRRTVCKRRNENQKRSFRLRPAVRRCQRGGKTPGQTGSRRETRKRGEHKRGDLESIFLSPAEKHSEARDFHVCLSISAQFGTPAARMCECDRRIVRRLRLGWMTAAGVTT